VDLLAGWIQGLIEQLFEMLVVKTPEYLECLAFSGEQMVELLFYFCLV
jgi:hypothetical protein